MPIRIRFLIAAGFIKKLKRRAHWRKEYSLWKIGQMGLDPDAVQKMMVLGCVLMATEPRKPPVLNHPDEEDSEEDSDGL